MTHWKDDCNKKKGSSRDTCLATNMDLRALIGHKAEAPTEGMVVDETLSCIVLDHFMMTVAPASEKINISHRCLLGSKAFTSCGSMLVNLRKEKKQNRYNAVKTCELGRC